MPWDPADPQATSLFAAKAAEITLWLLTDERTALSPGEALDALALRLRAAGMPLWRAALFLPRLDPQVLTVRYAWRDSADGVEERAFTRATSQAIAYHHSPIALMQRTRATVRRKLQGPDAELDFPVLEEFAAEGATDYLLTPLPVGRPQPGGLSLATRDPAGFAECHVALIEAIAPALRAICENHVRRATLPGLLAAYVGHEAGRHILDGRVTLHASRSIEAVILFSDMRDFTALSESLPKDDLLRLLNDYFAVLVPTIERAGGEVLKFLGDGLLAIFRLGEDEPPDDACARSLIAAIEAQQAFEAANAARRARGQIAFSAGIALHVGTVFYGNIGTAGRLDFTVIGPAVNLASRIEKLTRDLNKPILTSAAFAAASPVALQPEGVHALRGLADMQEVFSPVLPDRPVTEPPGPE